MSTIEKKDWKVNIWAKLTFLENDEDVQTKVFKKVPILPYGEPQNKKRCKKGDSYYPIIDVY